jgi:hypothetical protein
MECRKGCGACCIYISISSPLPNHPNGKPPGKMCHNLKSDLSCSLWETDQMPEICKKFKADPELCGSNFIDAKNRIKKLEELTNPY